MSIQAMMDQSLAARGYSSQEIQGYNEIIDQMQADESKEAASIAFVGNPDADPNDQTQSAPEIVV